jgi:hypothetical protein
MSSPESRSRRAQCGPITYTFNAPGARSDQPTVTAERGWVYLIELRRLCALCKIEINALNDGQVTVLWEEPPPRPDDRCEGCQFAFGERRR